MARYVENWRVCNPSGLTNRSVGVRQSGMSRVAYLAEHPKARGLRFTLKGELDRRYHSMKSEWRGMNPVTGRSV